MTRTNAYTLLCVGIRTVAVYAVARVLLDLPQLYVSLRRSDAGGELLVPVLGATLLVIPVAGVLWLFADKVARLALSRPGELVFDSDLDARTWLGLAISAIGAWFLFNGVVDLFYLLSKWILVLRVQEDAVLVEEGVRLMLPDVVATLLEMALAVVFLLRGQGLSRWFHRMRYGELPVASDPGGGQAR